VISWTTKNEPNKNKIREIKNDNTPSTSKNIPNQSISMHQNIPLSRNYIDISVNLATWNIRGCSPEIKRIAIDEILHTNKIDIACLQETKLSIGYTSTEHYEWHHISNQVRRQHRGIAILICKGSLLCINKFEKVCNYVCLAIFNIKKTPCVYNH
jgi:hypothetical protein